MYDLNKTQTLVLSFIAGNSLESNNTILLPSPEVAGVGLAVAPVVEGVALTMAGDEVGITRTRLIAVPVLPIFRMCRSLGGK